MRHLWKIGLLLIGVIIVLPGCQKSAEFSWYPAKGSLLTRWSKDVNPGNAWPQYPRPQLARSDWINLNGLWDFAVCSKDSIPKSYVGKILVPYPVESALSGVARKVGKDSKLWYKKEIVIPKNWREKCVLLNFEAVDWETHSWFNGHYLGVHRGGYNPFSFDISAYIIPGEKHELVVSVWDPTDEGYQPRGKQVNNPGGIFYTSVTGIWQTVWLEAVFPVHITDLKIETDIDRSLVRIKTTLNEPKSGDSLVIRIYKDGQEIVNTLASQDQLAEISIPDPTFWSPETPFLYDLSISLFRDNLKQDEVQSYFGMRKISLQKDEKGVVRLALNNGILFQNGPLDQGFWPDGIYTPPTEEAMRYDLEIMRLLGFNMLRKHVKIESRLFYYWCDKLGILVWQDMPSAAGYVPPGSIDLEPSAEHKEQFEQELSCMIQKLYNHPSIVMWIPFNEGWGQYDTQRVTDLIQSWDPTRLVNSASGWEDRGTGDVLDIHHYPEPRCPERLENRAAVLGEFGGLGFYVEGHSWQTENWGYEQMISLNDLQVKYEDFYLEVFRLRDEAGLAACVYTQTSDVETETNGLLTYDRELVKMGIENIQKAHQGIIPARLRSPFREFTDRFVIDLLPPGESVNIYYTLDSSQPDSGSALYREPIEITETTLLKTIAQWPGGKWSRINTFEIRKVAPSPPIMAKVNQGLKVSYYEGVWEMLPDFAQLIPIKQETVQRIDTDITSSKELFALLFEGYLDVPQTGVYHLYLSSDDGGRIYLDGALLIDYDGIHGAGIRKSSAALEKGLHPFRVEYFQRYGGLYLSVSWEGPGIEIQEVQPVYWKH